MNYVLVTIFDNWADEIDTQGFLLTTQEEVDDYFFEIKQYFINNPDDYLYYSIGTNEEIEHYNLQSIERCLKVKKINEEEYKTINKTIGSSFGITTLWNILAYN